MADKTDLEKLLDREAFLCKPNPPFGIFWPAHITRALPREYPTLVLEDYPVRKEEVAVDDDLENDLKYDMAFQLALQAKAHCLAHPLVEDYWLIICAARGCSAIVRSDESADQLGFRAERKGWTVFAGKVLCEKHNRDVEIPWEPNQALRYSPEESQAQTSQEKEEYDQMPPMWKEWYRRNRGWVGSNSSD